MLRSQSPLQFLFLPSWPWPAGQGQQMDVTLGNPSAWAAAEMPPTQPQSLESAGHLPKRRSQENAQVLRQTRAGVFYGCWEHLILR